jgi:hypothetical protein
MKSRLFAKATYQPSYAGEIDISTWNLSKELAEEAEKLVLKAATESITLAAEEYPAEAWFPVIFFDPDKPEPKDLDPMLLRIELPLGPYEGEDHPHWEVSLVEVVATNLDYVGRGDRIYDGLAKLRDGFLALAATIDAALKEAAKGEE